MPESAVFSLEALLDLNGPIVTFTGTVNDRVATSLQDILYVLDFVTTISEDSPELSPAYIEKVTQLILIKFRAHLRQTQDEWNHLSSPQLYTIAKQLEAIAYVSGQSQEILRIINEFPLLKEINCNFNQKNNFLSSDEPLKFPHFDRCKLALQMLLRILDPRYIQQREESVCGVTGFVQNIALINPLLYVHMVNELATQGVFDFNKLSDKQGTLKIELTEPNILKKNSAAANEIHDVDHIVLNGIRSSENSMNFYSAQGASVTKQVFGVTTPDELKQWMKQSGYKNVSLIPINTKERVAQLNALINDGYTVEFLSTCTLARIILNPDAPIPAKKNALNTFMDGHFFIIKSIQYNKAANKKDDTLTLRIITWGEEKEVTIPYKVWTDHQGAAKAIVGLNPYMSSSLRAKGREVLYSSDLAPSSSSVPLCYSAHAYCLHVKSAISQESQSFKKISKMIDAALNHKNGQSWMESAKKIQDYIDNLPEKKRPKNLFSFVSIVPTVNQDLVHELKSIYHTKNIDSKIERLERLMSIEDSIEIRRQLLPLYVKKMQWDAVKALFNPKEHFNRTDKKILCQSLQHACSELLSVFPESSLDRDILALLKLEPETTAARVFLSGNEYGSEEELVADSLALQKPFQSEPTFEQKPVKSKKYSWVSGVWLSSILVTGAFACGLGIAALVGSSVAIALLTNPLVWGIVGGLAAVALTGGIWRLCTHLFSNKNDSKIKSPNDTESKTDDVSCDSSKCDKSKNSMDSSVKLALMFHLQKKSDSAAKDLEIVEEYQDKPHHVYQDDKECALSEHDSSLTLR